MSRKAPCSELEELYRAEFWNMWHLQTVTLKNVCSFFLSSVLIGNMAAEDPNSQFPRLVRAVSLVGYQSTLKEMLNTSGK